ncbi:MAG: hypothetical protein HUJ29_12640 [Gammaproteobacteria bacterium]|nr:hypothetical protein [Gammaproteobacteria bacterium]
MAEFNPVSTTVKAVSKGVETVAGVFTTNKEKDAQRAADEQVALLKAYQAEFNEKQNRTWVDSLADAFNRLVRPLIASLTLFIFVIAYLSPEHMTKITLSLSSIPDGYWALLSVIIAFYFGGRMQLKSQQFKFNESQVTAVKALIETKKEFRKLEMDDDEPDKAIGDAVAKSSEVDAERTTQGNTVIAAALKYASTNVSQEELKKKIEEIEGESVSDVKTRKRYGKKRRFHR